MKAAICEDEVRALKIIRDNIDMGMKKLNVDCDFDTFSDPKVLEEKLSGEDGYDLFFLDIEMPGINGIDLSKKIRFYLPNALIIFISNKEELVFQTFEVRPFRFIRKNHFKEEIPSVLKDIKRELDLEKGPVISIEEPGGHITSFSLDDILYIEAMRKECVIHRKTDTVICKYKFSDFLKLLSPYSFAQTHRSYAVNCKYIFKIDSDSILLDNDESIPLGRTHRDAVKKSFLNYAKSV
ncbi:MAG: LytTR family DNA-binding domain-containing protein [Lachnospiraceae bacterium]|nr:LytTR family DNA-binding domain-containing protein [Lachnospiraceae bacterium]